jgi:hypothetical protein
VLLKSLSVAKLNISIDDISPHSLSSTRVLKQCYRIIAIQPDIKFTLFVPAAYWRTIGPTSTPEPLWIDRFPTFCQELRELSPKNFEIAFHGLYHGIPYRSNNDEFQNLSFEDAIQIVKTMLGVVINAGLLDLFKMILRPPAWRMSSDAFLACAALGINTFALSPDDYAMATYQGAQINRRVNYYNCCPPTKPLKVFDHTEIVYHACEWDRNYFSDERVNELVQFLNSEQFEYVFIDGLIDG